MALKINDLDINYSISNSPKETLKHILILGITKFF